MNKCYRRDAEFRDAAQRADQLRKPYPFAENCEKKVDGKEKKGREF